ncbi:MAG: ABC transporter substrate-binding protein [Acetobacteraceae bacterium]
MSFVHPMIVPRRRVLKGAALGGAALAVGPGVFRSPSAFAATPTQKLVAARVQDNTTFDPILTIQNADIWVLDNMNANLVRVTYDGAGLEPDLAESWKVENGGARYLFQLRDGLLFSDGSPIRASDVKFSLERLRNRKDSVMGNMYQIIETIAVPDDRHVEITLSEASAPFLSTMAMFSASVLPEAAVKARGAKFGSAPVGAGAFKFVEWRRQDRVVLTRNEHYWQNSKVQLDQVLWTYVPNSNTRILDLESKEVDATIFIPFNRIDELQRRHDITVELDPSSREDFIIINHAKKPLDDVRVRRALYMGTNREELVKIALFGHGKVSNSFIPAGALYYNPENKDYPYDPDKAKALLKEAGAGDLALSLLIPSDSAIDDQLAVLLQSQYQKIGVRVAINKEEEGQQWNTLQAGKYELSVNYWTNDIIDPDEKATFCLYGYDDNRSYFTNYKSPVAKNLIEEGRRTMDSKERQAIYDKLQKLAMEDVVYINLYYSPFRNASLSKVNKFYQNPTGRFMLEETSITSA